MSRSAWASKGLSKGQPPARRGPGAPRPGGDPGSFHPGGDYSGGIFIIFVYNIKTLRLYRLQRNFINNFTHEPKRRDVAKTLLETLRKYDLPGGSLKYINYMIHDADRQTDTISRMLNLARIESKTMKGKFISTDLVAVVNHFYKKNRHVFKVATSLFITFQPDAGVPDRSFPV
jgi:signal transduction histidine kinase